MVLPTCCPPKFASQGQVLEAFWELFSYEMDYPLRWAVNFKARICCLLPNCLYMFVNLVDVVLT